ncbi:hypothetical protein AA0119_g5140 [Alternaria tenuissima]|uniref:Guanine nucleotide-exchange factor SEC12 n=1 Tax=Alternaria tenuissima TaxID=119927 RepID=A0A4Q4PI31_9PLEO|nr:hypothetical protein AA0115_g1853 [Alternaria tenuissima]RYO03123.1 hypothetical protein AA0119_g5140 [Alternaria tenuissima]RYO25711.1 hypothetical protein AA0121_g1491 [Alternaria tenuissima]RYO55986.1 hypothetical protein AA0116_g8574 [Alternaria tenuissima]
MSRPAVSKAQTTYPIFAATFASNRPGVLVVGGGGGAGRSGVKNQITAYDFTSRAPTIQSFAEIEASKDDSITCLDNLSTKDGLILFAGNGSSEEERLKGNNEHLRAFELKYPKSAEKTDGKVDFVSKTKLFKTPKSDGGKKEGYQRIAKLSPARRTTSSTPSRRIGAIASSLAGDENEIVIFSATSTKPADQDVIGRIDLHQGQEANDLDIFTQEEGEFRIAYVTDSNVFVQDVNWDFDQRKTKGKNEHRKLYTIPHVEKGAKSKLRCVRWLSSKHLLLLKNLPNRTGVELLLIHLYEDGPASVVLRKTLPKHVKAATDMDVSLLDADEDGAYQIAIAVAAIDISLTVYTMDYHGPARDSLSSFHAFNSYDNVHDVQMTKAVFSPFYKPEVSTGRQAPPQYLRLASTSLGNTISVETFQLQYTGSRYVLQTARSRNLFTAATYLVGAMIVAVIALLIQSLVDPEGNLTKGILPASLQNAASRHKSFGETLRDKRHNAILNNANSPVVKTTHRIADLLHLHLPHVISDTKPSVPSGQQKALVIHHDPESDGTLSTEVHAGDEDVLKKHAAARKWEELSHEERNQWKEKLSDAGMWAVGEGETILKSIFFGQLGGAIGHAAEGVLAG